MKVILRQDDKKLGKRGDVVDVSEGYARNFLLPKNLAMAATEANLNQAKQQRDAAAFRAKTQEDQALMLCSQLGKVQITVKVKVGENGKLFGSVTAKDVAEALVKETGLDIDRRKIELKEPIKKTGEYKAVAKLHPNIAAEFAVRVQEEE
ncbi:MAG: 50S ribosomal protein L9 [Acidaminococcales bacterium]|nr:50S ribosomal protein L9 [Acidaminococcales bacterium]